MILSHMAPSCRNMSSYRAIWTHFRQISMIFEQINMHAPLAMFLVGRHNLQTPHPSCMLLAQPAACTGLPCVVHSFWLCLIFCARYSFNSILEAPNLWVRCSRLFSPEQKSRLFETLRKSSQGRGHTGRQRQPAKLREN